MNTTRIKLKPYLREFLIAKYGDEPIRLPDDSDILAFLHELRIKRPKNATDNQENTELVIPYKKFGKDPCVYTYLTPKAQYILQNKIHTYFTAIFNDYIAYKVHILGIDYHAAIVMFTEEYMITGITYEGLKQKNYRDRNGKRFLREYKFKKLNNIKSDTLSINLNT